MGQGLPSSRCPVAASGITVARQEGFPGFQAITTCCCWSWHRLGLPVRSQVSTTVSVPRYLFHGIWAQVSSVTVSQCLCSGIFLDCSAILFVLRHLRYEL
jgi:hypothetical protein